MNWKESLVTPHDSIKSALEAIGRSNIQLALVVDDQQRLLGVATDGDIRRAILEGITLDHKIGEVMNTSPKVISNGHKRAEIMAMMREYRLLQIPILDKERRVVDVALYDQFIKPGKKENPVVIMAGGLGKRLRPLTESCPKPMLLVGNKPILQSILEQLKKFGFYRFFISVNYLSEQITSYFGDGSEMGCEIRYLHEKEKLGTAGALGLIEERFEHPVVVMNGDLLTRLNFDQLLEFHYEKGGTGTMCVRDYDFQIPYGVVNVKGHYFQGVEEKPVERFFVNAGIYVIEPDVIQMVDENKSMGMTELFEMIARKGEKAAVFPIREYWTDIGRHSDFKKANEEYARYFH